VVAVAANSAPDVAAGVHVHTAAFTVDSVADGSVRVTWDKQRYFEDHDGLEAALRQAGIPVLIKVGEFCMGPNDDPAVGPSGAGPGVDKVVHGERSDGSDRKPDGNLTDEAGSQADKKAGTDGDDGHKDGHDGSEDGGKPDGGRPGRRGCRAGPAGLLAVGDPGRQAAVRHGQAGLLRSPGDPRR
jgi:hypothetical protein